MAVDVYKYSRAWNCDAIVAGLRNVDQVIDRALRETDDAATAQAVPARSV